MAMDPPPLENSPTWRSAFLLSRCPAPRDWPLIESQYRLDNPIQLRGHRQRASIAQVLPALFVNPPLNVHAERFPHLRHSSVNAHCSRFRILGQNLETVVQCERAHLRQISRVRAEQFAAQLRSADKNGWTDPLVRYDTEPASATLVTVLAARYGEPL